MSESGVRFIEPPQPDDRVVAVEMRGEMTAEDMKAMVERFQAVLDRGAKALLFIDMREYTGFELAVIGEKLRNIGMLWSALDKYAVVGDKRWMEAWIKIMDPLTSPHIRHFQPEETEAAWAWLLASESVGST